jgi:hypothetical protein
MEDTRVTWMERRIAFGIGRKMRVYYTLHTLVRFFSSESILDE